MEDPRRRDTTGSQAPLSSLAGGSYSRPLKKTVARHLQVLILSVSLLAQVSLISVIFLGPKNVPLRLQESLPFHVLGWSDVNAAPDSTRACFPVFICTPSCPFCSDLADRHSQRSRDSSPGEAVQPYWFLLADSTSALAWGRRHGLSDRRVFGLSVKKRGLLRRAVVGDLWMFPMRVVLRQDLTVKDIRPSRSLPGERELRGICESKGIGPGSVEEYRAIVEGESS